LGLAVPVALGVPVAGGTVAGVVAVPPAGVAAPVSDGSAGEVVAVVEGVSPPPPSQAPSAVAKPKTRAIPTILVFITTPLSPIAANINFSLLNTIPHLLIFLNFLNYDSNFILYAYVALLVANSYLLNVSRKIRMLGHDCI
jgi:hypothetical protein